MKKIASQKNLTQQNCAFVNSAFDKIVHVQICAFLHLKKYLRCRFAHFVHDGFSHICTFVDLCFVHVQKVLHK